MADDPVTVALDAYRDEYHRVYPAHAGHDGEAHQEAHRCGIEAAIGARNLLGLEVHPTPAMLKGEQLVHQCSWCGLVAVQSSLADGPLKACPACGTERWWGQTLPLAGLHAPPSDLPYRYRIDFTVVIEGDGQHSDGDGAAATRQRLEDLLTSDPRTVKVMPGAFPMYLEKSNPTEEETTP